MQRLLQRSFKRFYLVELLLETAMLGLEAAAVFPSAEEFLVRRGSEAAESEMRDVQTSGFTMLPNPVNIPTADMTQFPDIPTPTSKVAGDRTVFQARDGVSWVLHKADVWLDGQNPAAAWVKYIPLP